MKISREVQIGVAVVIAAAVFWWGNRVFRDLPIFAQGVTYYTDLPHTQGLIPGSVVDIHGVGVGSVRKVDVTSDGARIEFTVDDEVMLPLGSYIPSGGLDLFSDPRMAIVLGPEDAEAHAAGDVIPTRAQTDLLGTLTEQTPGVLGRADTVLATTAEVVTKARDLLSSPESDLRGTLSSVRVSADALAMFLSNGEGSLQAAVNDVAHLVNTLVTLAEDSISATLGEVNRVVAQLDRNLIQLEETTEVLNEILTKINSGHGTLGRLVNEDSLYIHLDGSAAALQRILERFEENPDYYMQHLKVIEIF